MSQFKRKEFYPGGIKISYLDNEKEGRALICLHGHFGCGAVYTFLQEAYAGRLILLDQRGHGNSDRGESYKTSDYVKDLTLFCEHAKLNMPILFGHSLGGVNAYHYAAETGNVYKLIINEIGTVVDGSNEFILDLPREFDSLYEVKLAFEQVGMKFNPNFIESIRYDGTQWRFQFHYEDMVISQQEMNGAHWAWWEKVACPILLLHGKQSRVCSTSNMKEMQARNPHTRLVIYENAAHAPHVEERAQFLADVQDFLNEATPDHSL